METTEVLHILRNPHGWNDHVVRDARLAAADEIERMTNQLTESQARERALRDSLTKLVSYSSAQVCLHETTHRGGAIWEICEDCGAKWADDEGGMPEPSVPKQIVDAYAVLEISTDHTALDALLKQERAKEREYWQGATAILLVSRSGLETDMRTAEEISATVAVSRTLGDE